MPALRPSTLIAAALACVALVSVASAQITIEWTEDGDDLVATYAGSLNLAALNDIGQASFGDRKVGPGLHGFFSTGHLGRRWYSTTSEFVPIAGITLAAADSVSGSGFAYMDNTLGNVMFFTSTGSSISGTLTFNDTSLTDIFPNSYFSSGPVTIFDDGSNSITFSAVPEPGTTAALFALAGLAFAVRRRRRPAA